MILIYILKKYKSRWNLLLLTCANLLKLSWILRFFYGTKELEAGVETGEQDTKEFYSKIKICS